MGAAEREVGTYLVGGAAHLSILRVLATVDFTLALALAPIFPTPFPLPSSLLRVCCSYLIALDLAYVGWHGLVRACVGRLLPGLRALQVVCTHVRWLLWAPGMYPFTLVCAGVCCTRSPTFTLV